MKSETERFFDRLAPSWDQMNTVSDEHLNELLKLIPLKSGLKVLDVACGTGILTGKISDITRNRVLGIDISGEMIKKAEEKFQGNKNVEFRKEDFYTASYQDLDLIMIHNAYPHFLNVTEMKEQSLKMLKKGGYLVILHSISRKELSRHHSGDRRKVSRDLGSPEEEASIYLPEFQIVKAEEDDNHYLVLLQKK